MLCSIYQRYKLKAIHNESASLDVLKWLCSIYQRYKLKAIHNTKLASVTEIGVVLNISKIQTESNSQHHVMTSRVTLCCAQYIKDTN